MRRLVAALFFSTALITPVMAAESRHINIEDAAAVVTSEASEDFSAVPQAEEQLLIVSIRELPAGFKHAIIIRAAPQWDFFGTVWRKIATEVPASHQKIEDKAIYLQAKYVPHRLRKLEVRFNRT